MSFLPSFSHSLVQERVPDSPSPAPSLEEGRRPGSHPSSHRSSSVSSSPARTESSSDRIRRSYTSTCHHFKLYQGSAGFSNQHALIPNRSQIDHVLKLCSNSHLSKLCFPVRNIMRYDTTLTGPDINFLASMPHIKI